MYTIQKVLNSSVVLVVDENGSECILLAKGIGYGRKQGQTISKLEDGRIFIPHTNSDLKQLKELLDTIPAIFPELTQEIVTYAEKYLNTSLNEHIYLALTDHLHFAVERYKQNMLVTNRVFWEIKNFYPKEFAVGKFALELVNNRLDIKLPEEEAANVAFHIINAQKSVESQFDALRASKLIGAIVMLVTYTMKCQLDTESIHYARFISHLQFFVERFFSNKMLNDTDNFLYKQMLNTYPNTLNCAEKIRSFICKDYNTVIPDEEVAYLAIHIQRLTSGRK